MKLSSELFSFDWSKIPTGFNPLAYQALRPEAAGFLSKLCQQHDIPDKVRLFFHFKKHVETNGKHYKLNFEIAKSLFSEQHYEDCYEYLTQDLTLFSEVADYYPYGHWLVESGIKTGKQKELLGLLETKPSSKFVVKCLNALKEHDCSLLVKAALKPVVVFYAFNADYFDAFKASIFSLVASNKQLLSVITFVIGHDGSTDAVKLNAFLATLSIRYKLIDMSFCSGLGLKEEYGSESSEFKLDKSAYYRIFLLRHIFRTYAETHLRALYLDADTLVLGSLSKLLNHCFVRPVAARLEDESSKLVAESKSKNGIEQYFNSGVLLFNLSNSALNASIQKTIQAVTQQKDNLLLQDQCALNIGFNQQVDLLPAEYNYATHEVQTIAVNEGIVILHFSGRLKPWQHSCQDQNFLKDLWRSFFSAATIWTEKPWQN